ncbi:hypothetical protein F444_20069 [Phytophthora nicotianae P1976]|uniref:Peptidase A2 domain-containing protein n=1 Tax=Phytophthora nicotianae P1976 TaxID=1317066 RepID=A0A080Z5S9_PHYNI|nr:hypothetical protein F444_20069 [Phytophthora nicotianae P1976]
MITPRSASRTKRMQTDNERSRDAQSGGRAVTSSSGRRQTVADDSSSDDDDLLSYELDEDPQDELTRQMKEIATLNDADPTPRFEMASHRPLDRIKPFSGARNKSENSMQWLRTFVYEMTETYTEADKWCVPFELSLRDGAVHWFRQLPKKTKRKWELLSNAFIRSKRERGEHLCDYLNRLNGYARNTRLQFEKGGRDAKEHVQQFLVTCGIDHMAESLYHARVSDIHELEEIIEDMIKGKERMAKSDGTSRHSRSRDSRDIRREESHRRDRRDSDRRRDRRDSDRRRDEYRNQPRVTLAEASLDDLLAELEGREATQGSVECSDGEDDTYGDDTEDYGGYQSDGARSDSSVIDKDRHLVPPTRASGVLQRMARTPAQTIVSHVGTYQVASEASIKIAEEASEASIRIPVAGATTAIATSTETTDFCKQVHDVGQCELFRNFQDLAKFVQTKGTKKELPPELKAVRGSAWPDDYVTSVNATVCEKERTPVLGGGVEESVECADADGSTCECSFDVVSSAARDGYMGHSNKVKLNPAERQGWWSAKKFDRRIRIGVLVQGTVTDHRTRILLDTGTNVSVITDTFVKKLRLRDIPDHRRSIDIQGISEGKVSTTRRALVKITLGWEMVYKVEMWVMAHSAGVDVVLGADFMIPAGIRLDLFHGAAQLPNEVCIPLIETKNMVDSMGYSAHVKAGPTEALDTPGHESREYRLAKRTVRLEQHVL